MSSPSGADLAEALLASDEIVPAATDAANWAVSASSSSLIPIFLATAR